MLVYMVLGCGGQVRPTTSRARQAGGNVRLIGIIIINIVVVIIIITTIANHYDQNNVDDDDTTKAAAAAILTFTNLSIVYLFTCRAV